MGRQVIDAPMPQIGERELLVRVHTSVISTGTETMCDRDKKTGMAQKKELLDKVISMAKKQGIAKTIDRIKQELTSNELNIVFSPIGYSNAGIVVAKGKYVTDFNVGDRVSCCGAGIASHAEYVSVPVNLAAKITDNADYDSAAFATIGSIAMQGLRRSGVSFGETIVITGLGLIGLLAVQIAKAWGLEVIGVDINDQRNRLAEELGADVCFNANDPRLVEKVMTYTKNIGADAVIVYAATKSSGPVNTGFEMCRKKGTVVAVGAVGMDLEREKMYEKELNFFMSTSYGPGRYDSKYENEGHDYPIAYVRWTENRNIQEFIRLIEKKKINITPLVSGKYNVIEALSAYNTLIEDKNNIANIIEYPFDEKEDHKSNLIIRKKTNTVTDKKIKVGVIGAGGFVKARHLKNMGLLKDNYAIMGICNHTPGSTLAECENYDAKYVTTDYKELLTKQDIDLIVIGTRHNFHGKLVEDCINADKNVLVEKPLAVSLEEMDAIKTALEKHNVRLYVGYNRRYSPFVQDIVAKLKIEKKPIVVNYRINAGFISPKSWVQDPEIGAGRIIGEGCHFIDLISYICGGQVVESDIIHIPTSHDIPSEDNYIINLKYCNGNIGTLTYTSIGGSALSKERLEVFSDKKSYVINDFESYQIFGDSPQNPTTLKEADKGHYKLIEEIYKDLKGEDSIIAPVALDLESSDLTIAFINTINGSNGNK